MLKVSTVDSATERRILLEGTLVAPWIEELKNAWRTAQGNVDDREIVVDLENVTEISPEGEDELLELMKQGARFRSSGVLMNYVLEELANRSGRTSDAREEIAPARSDPGEEQEVSTASARLRGHREAKAETARRPHRNREIRNNQHREKKPRSATRMHFQRQGDGGPGTVTEVEAPGKQEGVSGGGGGNGEGRRQGERRHWLSLNWWVVALVLLGAVGLWFLMTRHVGAPVGQANINAGAVPITTAIAKAGSITSYLDSIGTVTPIYTNNITSQITGVIINVRYKEGEMVRRGAPLVDLDDRPYVAQLQQAEGTLEHDKYVLAQAKMDLARYKESWAGNGISQQTLQDQEKLVQQTQGTVRMDEGSVKYYQTQVEYCHIHSPINGRVGLRLVDPGNLAVANSTTALLVIAQIQPTTVVYTVAEDSLGAVRDQMRRGINIPVEVWDRQMSQKLGEGTLLTIDNQIDTTTGTVKVRAVFPNAGNVLFPNEFVNTRMPVGTMTNQILVPTSAVQYNGETSFVYVIQNGKAVMTDVKTVESSGGMTSVQGIKAGAVVANSSFEKLQNGSKVTVNAQAVPAPPSNSNEPGTP
jgi:membrane fusion protein, multidrug efflux system